MNVLVAFAWAASSLLATPAVSYEADLRTEARAYSDPSSKPTQPLDGAEEVDPRVSLLLHGTTLSLAAAYAPRVYWFEPQPTATPEVLHRAHLLLEDAGSSRRRVYALEDVEYGINYFSPLAGGGGAPGTVTAMPLPSLPGVLLAHYVSLFSGVGADVAIGPYFRLLGSGEYIVSGGADRTAQFEIPLQRGPRGEASVAFAPSHLNTFTTSFVGQRSSFTSGQLASLAQVTEGWRINFSRTVDAELFGGAAVAENKGVVGAAFISRLPVAGTRINVKTRLMGLSTLARLAVSAGPYLDLFAASVYERAEGEASLTFDYEHWDFNAQLRGTRLLSGWERRGETLVVLELTAAHLLFSNLKLEGGLRAFLQHGLQVFGAPVQGTLFVALTGVEKGAL